MNAKAFHDKYGREKVESVAKAAGTTYAYFQQIMYGNRFPSRNLARRLADASDGEMTWQELLEGDDTNEPSSVAA